MNKRPIDQQTDSPDDLPLSPFAVPVPARRITRGIPKNLQGRKPDGIYPHINRKVVAARLKRHITSVSNYFTGEQAVPDGMVGQLAKLCGVTVIKLRQDLQRQKVVRAREKLKRLSAGAAELGRMDEEKA